MESAHQRAYSDKKRKQTDRTSGQIPQPQATQQQSGRSRTGQGTSGASGQPQKSRRFSSGRFRPPQQTRKQPASDIHCAWCGSRDHTTSACSLGKSFCYYCKLLGHMSRDCSLKAQHIAYGVSGHGGQLSQAGTQRGGHKAQTSHRQQRTAPPTAFAYGMLGEEHSSALIVPESSVVGPHYQLQPQPLVQYLQPQPLVQYQTQPQPLVQYQVQPPVQYQPQPSLPSLIQYPAPTPWQALAQMLQLLAPPPPLETGRIHVITIEDAQRADRFVFRDTSWEEENWQAQYGQVVRSGDEHQPSFPFIDLWDWEIIKEPAKKNNPVYKLIGRTARCSNRLHPSVPAGGVLKTASIREVHLDLVRVTSGKVYRLRSPNRRYLTSLSSYDSSNPTKDWGFPDLYDNLQNGISGTLSYPNCQLYHTDEVCDIWSSKLDNFPNTPEKHKNVTYKDRAAARRMLHGDFSVGPGQKDAENRSFHEPSSSSQHADPEDAAAEAIKLSFGSGSYARRILKSMGWTDGEALGNGRKGILEPLRVVGNKGYAGLGWSTHIKDATS